jgi:hypothetical protein
MCPGDVCHPVDQCCPGMKRCGETTCIPENQCCDDEQACRGGTCVPLGSCCPDQRQCGPSTCVPGDTCCDDEVRCDDGACVPLGQCCPGTKPCNGRCVSEDICCTSTPRPTCDFVPGFHSAVCCHDKWVCQQFWDTPTCEPFGWLQWNPDTCDCGCPDGSVYNHEGGQNPVCCPSSHPQVVFGNVCGVEGGTIICPIGFSVCELGPGQWNCCPPNTVSSPGSPNAHAPSASEHGEVASEVDQARRSADHAARAAHGERKHDGGKARQR